MKKIILSVVALGATSLVCAQDNSALATNAVLISQTCSGNTMVSRYKIPHNSGKQAEFDLHYAISQSKIVPTFSNNSQQIADLKDFMAQTADSMMHISAIHVVGYASPDGNGQYNDSLAMHRANGLYDYAVNTYHPKNKIDKSYKTFLWSDCLPAVEKSSIPNKEQVIAVLKSNNHTEQQKESALRKMAESWRYLTSNILPQMRYADIEFDYGVDEIITRTTLVKQEEPAKPTTQPTQPEGVVVEEEVGIIIATPVQDNAEERREERKTRKMDKKAEKSGVELYYW